MNKVDIALWWFDSLPEEEQYRIIQDEYAKAERQEQNGSSIPIIHRVVG